MREHWIELAQYVWAGTLSVLARVAEYLSTRPPSLRPVLYELAAAAVLGIVALGIATYYGLPREAEVALILVAGYAGPKLVQPILDKINGWTPFR